MTGLVQSVTVTVLVTVVWLGLWVGVLVTLGLRVHVV